MALCASCGEQDDKNAGSAKITSSVFLKAISKMRATSGGDVLEGRHCYNLVSDESGKVLLYQAAMCLMEEVFIFRFRSRFISGVNGKVIICKCSRMLGGEIFQACRPLKNGFMEDILDVQVNNKKLLSDLTLRIRYQYF